MNISLIPKAFDCLRVGGILANPKLWKVGGMALSAAVGSFALSLNALGKAAGYDLNIDQQTAASIGAVAAWIVGTLFHIATTDKLGILPAKPVESPAVAGNAGGQAAPAVAPAPAGQVDSGPAHSDDPASDMPLGG
jgi:hypothetical protein